MKRLILMCYCLLQAYMGKAKVILPALISEHMVLQQKSTIKLWGQCKPFAHVSIHASWIKNHYLAGSDSSGNWQINIRTTNASGPYKMSINDGEGEVVINDVLLGEVWVCSGQSNMVMPLKGYDKGQDVYSSDSIIASSDKYDAIHVFDVPVFISAVAEINTGGNWKLSNTTNTPNFSAIAYELLPAAVQEWRQLWENKKLPFITCRLRNYTQVYFQHNTPLILKALQKMEDTLDEKQFLRVNRQQIVNINISLRLLIHPEAG